jgi:hypothetical protein
MLGEEFYEVPEDENVETYEYLRGLVDKNRASGWTTKERRINTRTNKPKRKQSNGRRTE